MARTRLRLRTVQLSLPALAVHGGAGTRPVASADPALEPAERAGLAAALDAGWAVLSAGGTAFDAAVEAVASMEGSGTFNAGYGAVRTTGGTVETDAAVMGVLPGEAGLREVSGAGCAMTYAEHPVHVAAAVARAGQALLLAGPGADAFAAAAGLPARDPARLTGGSAAPVSEMGTVGAVALDAGGHLAAATSTGGRAGQPPGRVGDAPIIGAGTWAAQDRVAVSATGDGEAFVRSGFAHLIDLAVGRGDDLDVAAAYALAAADRWGGRGGAIVLDAGGKLVILHDTTAMAQGWRDGRGLVAEIVGDD